MTARDRIRQAAIDNGWTIKFKAGDRHEYAGGGYYDSDLYVIGRVDRQLRDGTPVTEAEHEIRVWYFGYGQRDGQVRSATAHSFTVPQVIYRAGILGTIKEKNKEARILAALASKTSIIEGSPYG